MSKLIILHTTLATTGPLPALAVEQVPGISVQNIVDDTILPQLLANGGNLAEVTDRVVLYACFAAAAGADIILCACSSIGEIVPKAQGHVSVPIVRIDDAMADRAVQTGSRIGVAATLPTTLGPTSRLITRKAESAGRDITVKPVLVEGAYQKLIAGDPAGHDALLVTSLGQLSSEVDVVVLAQASMARVLPQLPQSDQARFLTSPQLAMERVKNLLESRV